MRRILLTLVPLAAYIGAVGSAPAAAAAPTGSAALAGPVPVQPFCVDVIVPVGSDDIGATVCTPWN